MADASLTGPSPGKKKNRTSVVQRVREEIAPTVESMGFVLWDVELVKEGSELDLVVTVDKKDGVSITDCENVSRAIDPIIDRLDPIAEPYCLEVSSAGLERNLKTPGQISAYLGEKVLLGFYAPADSGSMKGRRSAEARLISLGDGVLTVEYENETVALETSGISRIRTLIPDDAFDIKDEDTDPPPSGTENAADERKEK